MRQISACNVGRLVLDFRICCTAMIIMATVTAVFADATDITTIDNGDPQFSQQGFKTISDADSNGADAVVANMPTESTYARFSPRLVGDYDVYLFWRDFANKDVAAFWTVTHVRGKVAHRFNQLHTPGWHFHGSYTLDVNSFVELQGAKGTDVAIVADAVKFVPTRRRIVRRIAKNTITPVSLNKGDELHFQLRNGQVRHLKLIDTGASVLNQTQLKEGPVKTYEFFAVLEVDGTRRTIRRIVPTQESFYEPLVVGNMRIWLDAVSDIFIDDGGFLEQLDVFGSGTSSRPKRKARLAVNDVHDRICPDRLVWWYPETKDHIDVHDCYQGEDVWIGPFRGFQAHGGLDINMKSGTPLFAPIDFDEHYLFDSLKAGDNNNRWRGIRRWKNGSVWWLQAHHLNKMLVKEHQPLSRGTKYAETAGTHYGRAQHTHFVLRVFEEGESFFLDPWIFFWQTFQDNRKKPTTTTQKS